MRRPLAIVLTAVLLCAAAGAAAAVLRSDADARPRLVVDAPGPLVSATGLRPGQRVVACTTVRNAGDGRGRAALFASGVEGGLARHLRLTVTRGTGGRSRSCEGFAPDPRAYGLDGPGVVFSGRLSEFPASLAGALHDPGEWPAGAEHAFRFALALDDDPAAEALEARWSWRLAAEPVVPVAEAAASATEEGCASVRVAGAARGRSRRTLVRRARVAGRVRSVLVVRVLGAAGAERLVLTTGLRVRRKTLLIPRWAHVAYRVNGRRAAVAQRRPFRARVPAGAIRPGRNRVRVTVRRRGSRARTTTFRLRATATTIGGRRTCVLGA